LPGRTWPADSPAREAGLDPLFVKRRRHGRWGKRGEAPCPWRAAGNAQGRSRRLLATAHDGPSALPCTMPPAVRHGISPRLLARVSGRGRRNRVNKQGGRGPRFEGPGTNLFLPNFGDSSGNFKSSARGINCASFGVLPVGLQAHPRRGFPRTNNPQGADTMKTHRTRLVGRSSGAVGAALPQIREGTWNNGTSARCGPTRTV